MLANNSAMEFGNVGLDLSAWEAAISSVVTVLSFVHYTSRATIVLYALITFSLLAVWVRILSNYMLLKLHSNHPVLLSIISMLPGAILAYSIMLDRYAERSWEESRGGI